MTTSNGITYHRHDKFGILRSEIAELAATGGLIRINDGPVLRVLSPIMGYSVRAETLDGQPVSLHASMDALLGDGESAWHLS